MIRLRITTSGFRLDVFLCSKAYGDSHWNGVSSLLMDFSNKTSKVFYGWWIVGASVLIALYVGGVVFYGFTAVFEPIADEMRWSYTQISLAASLRGLETGLLAPLVGILVDRWGPRRIIFGGLSITAIGLIFLSRVTSLAMFYVAFLIIAIGMSCASMTVLMTAVANWFRRRVGMASGIAVSGFGLGGLLVPVMVGLIGAHGWRWTMAVLAVSMVAICLPISLLFRHKPEQYGSVPDGQVEDLVTLDHGSSLPLATEVNIEGKQALRSATFWRMALAFTCHTLLITAVITHLMPYLSSIGISRSVSSLVATAVPIMSIGGRLGIGWLGDKIDKRRVLALAFVMMGLGLLCFSRAYSPSTWLLVPFVVLFGIGYGGVNALRPSLVREYFGRANFGAIFGLLIGINMIGSIVGPSLAGWVYDNWHSYQGIWYIFASLPVAALISVLTVSRDST